MVSTQNFHRPVRPQSHRLHPLMLHHWFHCKTLWMLSAGYSFRARGASSRCSVVCVCLFGVWCCLFPVEGFVRCARDSVAVFLSYSKCSLRWWLILHKYTNLLIFFPPARAWNETVGSGFLFCTHKYTEKETSLLTLSLLLSFSPSSQVGVLVSNGVSGNAVTTVAVMMMATVHNTPMSLDTILSFIKFSRALFYKKKKNDNNKNNSAMCLQEGKLSI